MSKFIVFEGIDGSGKTTALTYASETLEEWGVKHICTREPGGTPAAERIRELVIRSALNPITTALMMFAARADHLQDVIFPALQRGEVVLSDRYYLSTRVYQSEIGSMAWDQLVQLTSAIAPDITIVLDCPVKVALMRAHTQGAFEGALTLSDYQNLRDLYLSSARQGEGPWHGKVHVVNTSIKLPEVLSEVRGILKDALET